MRGQRRRAAKTVWRGTPAEMEEGRQQKERPPLEKGARESCNRNLGHSSNSQRRICRKAQSGMLSQSS